MGLLISLVECGKVEDYIRSRSLKVLKASKEFLLSSIGGLYISFWCPERDYIFDVDPEDLAKELMLDSVDVLVIVAYRPFLIMDGLQSIIDRLNRWYGKSFNVKLIGVNSWDLEAGLEEAVGSAMAFRPFKIGEGGDWGEICPNCLKGPLRVYVNERLFSAKYRGRTNHIILGCPLCGLRIRRIELLD